MDSALHKGANGDGLSSICFRFHLKVSSRGLNFLIDDKGYRLYGVRRGWENVFPPLLKQGNTLQAEKDQKDGKGYSVQVTACILSFCSLYSMLSIRASQLAWMMFSETPTVPQREVLSPDSISTRVTAAVPAAPERTRTL